MHYNPQNNYIKLKTYENRFVHTVPRNLNYYDTHFLRAVSNSDVVISIVSSVTIYSDVRYRAILSLRIHTQSYIIISLYVINVNSP